MMKFDNELQEILNHAYLSAQTQKHELFTAEHVLLSALAFESPRIIIERCGVNIERLVDDLSDYLDSKIAKTSNMLGQSVLLKELFNRVLGAALNMGRKEVGVSDFLLGLFDLEESYASYYLRLAGLKKVKLIEVVNQSILEDFEQKELPFEEEHYEDRDHKKRSFLQRFAVNLNKEATEGRIETVIGREEELLRLTMVLSRRQKNNPLLIGDSGVGKTALAGALAIKITKGDIADNLLNKEVWSLDLGSLLAGTRYRGDFEERLKKLLNEVKERKNVILFIDEIHTIIGAGSTGGGSMDVSNLLKPALANGSLCCIGSTTYDEYKKIFERERALTRRFQSVEIDEPSALTSYAIIEGINKRFAEHHKAVYTPEALKAAVDLAIRFLPERKLPDKAIDIIDEAGAWAVLNLTEDKRVIDEAIIEKIVAKVARAPEKSVSTSEHEKLVNLEEVLKGKVFGQADATATLAKAVKRSRAGLRQLTKPMGSFLFVGPTGVGKTELAKNLAEALAVPLHRFDMSEYQEKHTVARLVGSPPGYVGYEEGGLLTDAIRKNPHSVLLLDEIEKAHRDIYNVLLSAMDYATITDSQGRKADLRNVIIIMTSNAGAANLGKVSIGFDGQKQSREAVESAVEKAFSPEFRNRLDKVIFFNPLDKASMAKVAVKELEALAVMLAGQEVAFGYSDKAVAYLAEKGYSEEFGARPLARLIEDEVKEPLVDQLLSLALKSKQVQLNVKKGKLSYSIEEHEALKMFKQKALLS
ncbi:MAG: AAA family ATPase [Spirochaetaceae bacterium]|nr:AAA family ATPase [Spirochaetaceae bacterium]